MRVYVFLVKLSRSFSYVWDLIWSPVYKRSMKHCGKKVFIRPMSSDFKGLENLSIGDYSHIPSGSTIYCTDAECKIGNHVLFGPHPTIVTGDHRTDIIGRYMADIGRDEKTAGNDQPVIIEDDVWCGANVTILKGARIGRGCVIAAGAVVTSSFPPYSIVGGVPARLISMRFTPEQIVEHERVLNNVE